MIEKRQNNSDKPKDYSSVKGPKLDERTDNSVVGPTKKSGRLLASVMQMIAIDNMYKY